MSDDHLTLKWGTLKSWKFSSEKGQKLLKQYFDIGASMSAMTQHDTPEQKELICQLIDECSICDQYEEITPEFLFKLSKELEE